MAINLVREQDCRPVCFHCCRKDVVAPNVNKNSSSRAQ